MNETAQEKTVQRLIRHRQTREYLAARGWTADPDEAMIFGDSLEAATACSRRGLNDVEMAVRIPGGSGDLFCTPLR